MLNENVNIESNAKQEKLDKAFAQLRLIVDFLESIGFNVEQNRIAKKSLQNWGIDGFDIIEDTKIKIIAYYNERDGIKIKIGDRAKDSIFHEYNELTKIDIENFLKDHGMLDLLMNNE